MNGVRAELTAYPQSPSHRHIKPRHTLRRVLQDVVKDAA